ncbi:cofilin [Trichomonascus vanleenenianus]|uniref:cofilin n=1 Tax=Trichomonascus vanleenenianus TaxID=2268995 RepID=UPI003ECB74CA
MSRSGIAVADDCISAFEDLKLRKTYKYIIYRVSDDKTQIIVEKTSKDADYEKFTADLPENESRYAIYDFEYELSAGEGKRNKIIFMMWSPDTASVKSKMVYASSKDAIRRALNGVAVEMQATDYSEADRDAVYEAVKKH